MSENESHMITQLPAMRVMPLRDWFAGMAMQGLLANSNDDEQWPSFDNFGELQRFVATLAYGYADAMLKARETKDGGS